MTNPRWDDPALPARSALAPPSGVLRALEEERLRASQAEQLAAILGRVGAAPDLQSALAVLARDAITLLRGDQGAVRAYGAEGQGGAIAFWVDREGRLEPAEHPETLPGTVAGDLRAGGPARVIEDLWQLNPHLSPEELRVLRRGMRSSVAVPITVNGQRIGSLHVDHHQVGFFGAPHLALAEALTTLAGASIERARLETRVRELAAREAARAAEAAAQQRLALLGEMSAALASSLDFETTLQNVARLAVPALADHCMVDLLEADGSIRRLVAVRDAEGQPAAAELARRFPPKPDGPHPVARVLRSGKCELYTQVSDEMLASVAQGPEHLAMTRELNPRSAVIAPLIARGRTTGAVTLVYAESGREYSREDVPVVEEMARRCALAVDNARLYCEAQEQAAVHVQLNAALRGAAEERDRALAEARAALSLRDHFLSLASHELRTPITSLRGYAQLLLRQFRRHQTVDPGQIRRALQLIDHQSEKLSRLAIQLLDTSRIETGKLILDRHTTDLSRLVTEVADATADVLSLNASVLHLEHAISVDAPGPVQAYVDRARLEQVLINLIDNAIKYSPNGGPVRLSVSAPDDEHVRVTVRDRGIGVPAEHRERIFDRFYQVQARGHVGGMGLGLYVSRQIVELHGGTLEAEFPDDGGACFTLTLPRRQRAAR